MRLPLLTAMLYRTAHLHLAMQLHRTELSISPDALSRELHLNNYYMQNTK
jgi:hypothetical protein